MMSGNIPSILIVDDELAHLDSLKTVFEREGYKVSTASSGMQALEIFRTEKNDIVLADLMMPGINGIDLLKTIKNISPQTEVIIMTAFGKVDSAVESMKEGAYDFIEKPLKLKVVVKAVNLAIEKQSLIRENAALKQALEEYREHRVIAESPAMKPVLETVRQIAPSSATVLILGESGTGKEVISRLIHNSSPRSSKNFLPINCAALPETILESELFGHEKGAFTGADRRQEGRFERANGGTILLDEVSEMNLKVQAKLLRVIEDGLVERLGGGEPIKVDVRILSASNKDLDRLVKEGLFREDLLYRLKVVTINLPPLRGRPDDIPLMAGHFVQTMAARHNKQIEGLTSQTLEILSSYSWPGNVRELQNTMERAVLVCHGKAITPEDLPPEIFSIPLVDTRNITVPIGTKLEDIEKMVIKETLKRTRGDRNLAARILGIASRTIYRKVPVTDGQDQ